MSCSSNRPGDIQWCRRAPCPAGVCGPARPWDGGGGPGEGGREQGKGAVGERQTGVGRGLRSQRTRDSRPMPLGRGTAFKGSPRWTPLRQRWCLQSVHALRTLPPLQRLALASRHSGQPGDLAKGKCATVSHRLRGEESSTMEGETPGARGWGYLSVNRPIPLGGEGSRAAGCKAGSVILLCDVILAAGGRVRFPGPRLRLRLRQWVVVVVLPCEALAACGVDGVLPPEGQRGGQWSRSDRRGGRRAQAPGRNIREWRGGWIFTAHNSRMI